MEPSKVCKVIPSAFGEDSHKMIQRTLEDGRERGFFVLQRDNRLSRSGIQKGMKTSIHLRMFNPFNVFGDPIGTIHSHPDVSGDELMSLKDASMLLDNNLSFIGIAFRDNREDRLAIFTDHGFNSFRAAIRNVASKRPDFNNSPPDKKLAISVTELNGMLQECEVAL